MTRIFKLPMLICRPSYRDHFVIVTVILHQCVSYYEILCPLHLTEQPTEITVAGLCLSVYLCLYVFI